MREIRIVGWVVTLGAMLLLTACASHDARMTDTGMMSGTDTKLAQLEEQQRMLDQRADDLKAQENALALQKMNLEKREANMSHMDMKGSSGETMQMAGANDLFPPNAETGHCYARLFIPAEYKTVTSQVLKHQASERVEIIPARYETVTERVLVEEASQRLEVIPAQYGFVTEKVLVEPAKKRLVQVPARYEQVSEQVMVKPAYTVWKKGTGPIQRIDETTGEILCLVEIPAEYRTVTKRVLKSPAGTREIEDPAMYKSMKRRVVTSPATTRVVKIPAKYKTVSVTKLVSPAQEKRIPIPAQYQTVTKQMKVSEDHMEWREILCDTNMTHRRIADIQRALQSEGFNPGPIDGVIGPQTMAAVNAFQKKNDLTVAKYLTISTVKALGVKL